MEKPAFMKYGNAAVIEEGWGLDLLTGQKVASIITFSGAIEYYLERAIWKLQGVDPKGIRPLTDGKVITVMIDMLAETSATLPSVRVRTMFSTWCETCRSGFTIRNNIVHGLPMKIGNTLTYTRNPLWHGEQRKKHPGDFWADANTLEMVCDAFGVLLRIIYLVHKGDMDLDDIATPMVEKALGGARSVLGEFASQDYNPSFEKY